MTAPAVRRIFDEYLVKGLGFYAIAEGLTADGVPSPSAHDRARNRHRPGEAWGKSAVRAILLNSRYTGRQVWNRQRRVEMLMDVEDVTLGHETKMKWNGTDAWVWSNDVVHDPIITVEEWEAVQARLATKPLRGDAHKKARATPRTYALRSLINCGLCGRRMQGAYNHGKPHYRCMYPAEYAVAGSRHPKSVYVREEAVLPSLDAWLGTLFDGDHQEATIESLWSAASAMVDAPAGEAPREVATARATISRCDQRLASYRAALDAMDDDGDPAVIARWISEATAERNAAQQVIALGAAAGPPVASLTRAESRAR